MFVQNQALEMEADLMGFYMLLEAELIESNRREAMSLIKILGALSFFWYVEMSDRINRILAHGEEWFDSPLYINNPAAQSLLVCWTHPSPLERGLALIHSVGLDRGENSEIFGQVSQAWLWLRAVFEKSWEQSRELMAHAVRVKGLTRDPKWVTELPLDGVALGVMRMRMHDGMDS